jgi:hypothetical protein
VIFAVPFRAPSASEPLAVNSAALAAVVISIAAVAASRPLLNKPIFMQAEDRARVKPEYVGMRFTPYI